MTFAAHRSRIKGLIFIGIILYIVILTSNQNNRNCTSQETKVVYLEKKSILADYQFSANSDKKYLFDLKAGRWDNQVLYKLFDRVIIGDEYYALSTSFRVSLATQTSLEKLFHLEEVAFQWNGPISTALYAAGNEELSLTLLYVAYLRKCNPNIRKKVTFHFAFPKNRMPSVVDYDEKFFENAECSRKEEIFKIILNRVSDGTKRWRESNPYPQNHMRNLARKNCVTPYVFLTDVDIVPCNKMAERLDQFLTNDFCNKCAFVIPTYEIDYRALNRWEINISEGAVRVSHPVTNFEMFYEPFYVAKDNVPPHDERFIGYGFTRNTQVYEMFVAGYQYQVLTPVFAIHWGLQDRRSRPHWREKQNANNNRLFQTFKKELYARYQRDPLHLIDKKFKN